ncbi:DNA repair protein RecO [Desulfonispora thiosulfatigenes]|nr:DNA repair protein RecO [Desulfonispora thiosulfatigenes]
MKNLVVTEGIILRSRNYKEADQLITIYTQKLGKITAIAKGVRKTKSKLRGGLQIFSHSNLSLYIGKNLATVTQSENINSFLPLRSEFDRMNYASFISELIDALLPEAENDEELFTLILKSKYLLSFLEPLSTTHLIVVRLLDYLGYKPELESCTECGQGLDNNLIFSPNLGGLICSECKKNLTFKTINISGESKIVLQKMMDMDLLKFSRIKISPNALKEIDNILDEYITYILGKRLKSKQVLDTIL